MRVSFLAALAIGLTGIATPAARSQTPLSTAFTYQGQLASSGTPASGTYDVRFSLFDAATGGNQIGTILCSDDLTVTDGRFSVALDFGAVFTGNQRFLEIQVRENTGLGCSDATGFTVLSPRQALTATPYAGFAQVAGTATAAQTASNALSLNGQPASFFTSAANLTGTLPGARLSGTYSNALTFNNAANVFTGNGAGLTNLSASNLTGVLDAARMPTNWGASGDLMGFYPSPLIVPGSVTMNKLAPSVQSVLSSLSSLTPPVDAIGWGANQTSQLNVPALPAGLNYVAVGTGVFHSIALRSDGTVVAWGDNTIGQTDVPVLPAGTSYTAIAAGVRFNLALRTDGQIVGWGDNEFNQTSVPPLPAGVRYTAVYRGFYHGMALRSDGSAVAWGPNISGENNIPALPAGLTYTALAGGFEHSLGLRSNGTVVGWGSNTQGQLNVPALPVGVTYTAVAAGEYHSLALRSDGTVVAWGSNSQGQTNVPVLPAGVTYTAVDGGIQHSVALRSDGTVVAWGSNATGQTNVAALPPGKIYTGISTIGYHTLALRETQTVPALRSDLGLSIGSSTPPPASGGISVAGNSSFAAGVTAASFTGSGSSLTNLNASNISSGTLADTRISSNIPRLNISNTFAGTQQSFTSTSGINVLNGVIQKGGGPLTTTTDLGLYSQTTGNWIRFVTNNAQFAWFSDAGAGTTPRMVLTSTGNLTVQGSLAKGGGSFKIDHPLDPENKYLYHSFVESPDMMNIYNGNVTTDSRGLAVVELPDYFEALNRDFRYQLTVLDDSEHDLVLAKVYRKIGVDAPRQFTIRTSMPGVEVSWQVTGIRKDAWAEKNRIPNAVDKLGAEKGRYLHPDAFGKPASMGMPAVREASPVNHE